MNALDAHLYEISKGVKFGEYTVPDLGQIIPGSLMMHELINFFPTACNYMNGWGTNFLGVCPEEIIELGEEYYDKFFIRDEIISFRNGLQNFLNSGEFDNSYNFFQRVMNYHNQSYVWCFTTCKFLNIDSMNKLIILSTPVEGIDHLIQRVNKTLDLNDYLKINYKKFAQLTNREKEIIRLLSNGLSTPEISDQLFISTHTVATHRKNICKKTESKTFAELLKFAITFDLT